MMWVLPRSTSKKYVLLRLKLQKFPSPRWETADALASSLTCTTAADAPVNSSATDVYVPQRPGISHCPDGKMAHALALILACTTATDTSVNYRGCVLKRPCKVPIAPMGKLLTRLPRLTFAQLRTLRSTTECTCRRDLESSHGPDGKIADVLALTLA